MSQQRLERDALLGFVDWLAEHGFMLHETDVFRVLSADTLREVKMAYRSKALELISEYTDHPRNHENQPIWCARHQQQTCDQCFAHTCCDNMFRDDVHAVRKVGSVLARLLRGETEPDSMLSEAVAIERALKKLG